MPDNDSGQGAKKKYNKKYGKGKKTGTNSPPESAAASSASGQQTQKPAKNQQNQQNVQFPQRFDVPPPPIAWQRPQPLMYQPAMLPETRMAVGGPFPQWSMGVPMEETRNVDYWQSEANKRQKEAYYFSAQAGTAASIDAIKDRVQYTFNNFPLDRNENILVDRKYNLLISPLNSRCHGLFIRVKGQRGDETLAASALVHIDSDDELIRAACIETMQNFTYVLGKSNVDRCPFSTYSEQFLEFCHIKKLNERLEAFPEAIYYCEKCDFHINTVSHAKTHLENSAHFDDIERQQQRENLLNNVPEPSPAHLEAINRVLNDALKMQEETRTRCEASKESFLYYLTTQLFHSIDCGDVKPKLFGSSTYDLMLSDSDLNVAYSTDLPSGTPIFAFLEKVRKQISDDGYPANHSMDMGTSSTIVFTFEDIRVRLCWFSNFSYRSQLYFSALIQTYISLRPEVVQFLQLIRLWAKIAGVDSKNAPRIGLPRYGFDILAIHYLQQVDMLPVLHELYTEDVPEEQEVISEDQKQETSPVQPEEARQRRMRLMSKYQRDIEKIRQHFDLTKEWNMASLWIGFFRYYVKFHRDVVVQITQKAPMSKDTNRWNKKILHVVDPFRGDNVLSIPKVSNWQPFYFNCLLNTFISFSIPRTLKGPVVDVGLYLNGKGSPRKKLRETASTQRKAPVEPPKQMIQITEEEQYNQAADELAEEEEREQHIKQLKEKLEFDGIPLNSLTSEDVEIDEHSGQIYSRRTVRRIQRVQQQKLTNEELQNVECPEILNKRTAKRLKKLRKQQSEEAETPVETAKEEEEEEPRNVQVCTVMLSRARIVDRSPVKLEQEMEKRGPTPPVEASWKHWSTDCSKIPISDDFVSSAVKESGSRHFIIKPQSGVIDDLPAPKQEEKIEGRVYPQASSVSVPPSATFVVPSSLTERKEVMTCTEDFFIRNNFQKSEVVRKTKYLKLTDFSFEFSPQLFCGGYEMEMKCTHCDGNHCVENCPMMEIPPIEKFPPRSAEELRDIDNIIDDYYAKNILEPNRLRLLEEKVKELEKHLQFNYRDNVTLTIFGSVMTGLSVGCSDIDICLRFGDGHEPPADLTAKEVILDVEAALRKCKQAKKVQAIVGAKVPIVKFYIRLGNDDIVDVDISYYNILALYNTKLLKEYTLWTPDNRFAKLALFIKNWAKSCDIGEASRGSLSSYAHTILLISYLQQCDPPVLPRLQEDFRSENQERRIIENWDTSFVEAEDRLVKRWTKNKETCAQLLLGYLDYYSRFDFRNFVVQCRREMLLSKVEKDWLKPLCVEDPFDLNHNLSSGLSKKMFVFVMKVFIGSRAAFMSAKPEVPRDSMFLENYKSQLFRLCHQGSAPSDRQCHQCHRIGHFIESCPQRAQINQARRRNASNSTTSTYRTNAFGGAGRGDVERITYHKRPYNNRRFHN